MVAIGNCATRSDPTGHWSFKHEFSSHHSGTIKKNICIYFYFKEDIRDHSSKLTRLCLGKRGLGLSSLMNLWKIQFKPTRTILASYNTFIKLIRSKPSLDQINNSLFLLY